MGACSAGNREQVSPANTVLYSAAKDENTSSEHYLRRQTKAQTLKYRVLIIRICRPLIFNAQLARLSQGTRYMVRDTALELSRITYTLPFPYSVPHFTYF